MKVVMIGIFEYIIPHEDHLYKEPQFITEGIVENPDSLKHEVLTAMRKFGIAFPSIDTNSGFTYFGEGGYRSYELDFTIKIVPAIQIGEKFYKLEEITGD